MSRRRRPGDDASRDQDPEGSFAEATRELGDVVRIEQPVARITKRAAPKSPSSTRPRSVGPTHYEFPEPGEPRLGHVVGLPARDLARLAGGRPAPTARIDLHGHTAAAAKRRLRAELGDAAERGVRTVLVIHGRGHHSAEGASVLREALPGWLTDLPLANRVLAFAPARARDGGEGATYVLLKVR